jgi:transposase
MSSPQYRIDKATLIAAARAIERGLNNVDAGKVAGLHRDTIRKIRQNVKQKQINIESLNEKTRQDLYSLLLGREADTSSQFSQPDWIYVTTELKKHKRRGITLGVLYDEYFDASEKPMSDRTFRRKYQEFKKSTSYAFRKKYAGGEYMFIDFSGTKLRYFSNEIGRYVQCDFFVAAMGASNKLYGTVCDNQKTGPHTEALIRAFEFFGGVTTYVVPDNLKAAVIHPGGKGRAPVYNPYFKELSNHYNFVPEPARPRKPTDKAPVERGVRHLKEQIVARLRNRKFFSKAELENAVQEELKRVNEKTMRNAGNHSRNSFFDEVDKPNLIPLPDSRYEFLEDCGNFKVPPHYHINIESHDYSVPYSLVSKIVNVRRGIRVIEFRYDGSVVCTHPISTTPRGATTNPQHQRPEHIVQTHSREFGHRMGSIRKYVLKHLENFQNFPATLRADESLQKLIALHGDAAVEKCCNKALHDERYDIEYIRILVSNHDKRDVSEQRSAINVLNQEHENVRGSNYYFGGE